MPETSTSVDAASVVAADETAGKTQAAAGEIDDRTLFHRLLCFEDDEDPTTVLAAARLFLKKTLERAEDLINKGDPLLQRFPYSVEAVNERLDAIYHDILAGNNHDAKGFFRSRDMFVDWMTMLSPHNLVDGAWLSGLSRPGPISLVHAKLLAIWFDEVGEGTAHKNHCNVWWDTMKRIGVELPRVDSVEFAHSKAFPDSAFTNPVLQMAVGRFPKAYFPELIGMNLWLEYTSPPFNASITNIALRYDIDPTFYRLHTAIDNKSTGHGAQALDIVHSYLRDIPDAAQRNATWQNMWTGFVAFELTFCEFDPDLESKWSHLLAKTPRQRFLELLRSKGPSASKMHAGAQLAGRSLNDWFADVDAHPALADALAASSFIKPGNADASDFLTSLIDFTGPMYRIFTDAELQTIRDWINSLDQDPASAASVPDPLADMLELVERRRVSAARTHKRVLLGDTPLQQYFAPGGDLQEMLRAMKQHGMVEGGEDSRLMISVKEGSMRSVFTPSDVQVIRAWLEAGSPC